MLSRQKVVFAEMPERVLKFLLREEFVLEEELTDSLLPDPLVVEQAFQLLLVEKANAHSGFAKADAGLEMVEDGRDILLVYPTKGTTNFPETWSARALPG